jgi:hypothetical protein
MKKVKLFISLEDSIIHYSYSSVFTQCGIYMNVDKYDQIDKLDKNLCECCKRLLK